MKDKRSRKEGPRKTTAAAPRVSDRRFAVAVTFVFVLLAGAGISSHEMWRDEYQAWMLAAGSESLSDLYRNMRYDGHPLMWHAILLALSRAGAPAASMKVLHLAIAAANVWMICRYAPFRRGLRLMAPFGYFLLYEYTVISRNYGLGLFFVLLFCVIYRHGLRHVVWLGVVLFFMANTQLFGAMTALACLVFLASESVLASRGREEHRPRAREVAVAAVLAAAGQAAAYLQMSPPADGGYFVASLTTRGFDSEALAIALTRPFTAYFAIPQPGRIDFWDSNFMFSNTADSSPALGLLVLIVSLFSFLHHRRSLVLYVAGTCGLLFFFYLTSTHFILMRYVGTLYVVFFASFWLSRMLPATPVFGLPPRLAGVSEQTSVVFFGIVLAAQMVGGAIALRRELAHPFSNSAAAADYLRGQGLDAQPIVAARDYVASSLAGALGRPLYYPEKRGPGTFITWNEARRAPYSLDDLAEICGDLHQREGAVLLVLSEPLTSNQPGGARVLLQTASLGRGYVLTLEKAFDQPSIAGDENYYIYRVRKGV